MRTQSRTCPHAALTATGKCTNTHEHTCFPWARGRPSCPSRGGGGGLRQGRLSALLPTGLGACLLPVRSVPPPRPDLVDFSKLTKSNANYNLQRAFRTAEQHLGLTRLLDPEGEPCIAPARLPLGGTPDPNAIPNSTPSCCNTIPNSRRSKSQLPSGPSPSSSPIPPPPRLPVPPFGISISNPSLISLPVSS